jgi:small subunit ribosomal protein S18
MKKTSTKKTSVYDLTYKDYEILGRFITDRAKILPRKRSGLLPKAQRKLATEIKRARHLGLLPYKPRI